MAETEQPGPGLLPSGAPSLADPLRRRLEADYDRYREALPGDLRAHCLEAYGVDLQGEYGGAPIANPFGKASGQLSLNVRQVRRDAEAGLGFVVLKTVIAEDERGERKMAEWAIPETRMRVERITGEDGTEGWTVTWKGRGWHESFESYCRFFGEALEAGAEVGMRVAPSVKYHLPAPGEGDFNEAEYRFTTGALLDVWAARHSHPMPVEKDFSPTLAGDDRSREQDQILTWLRRVPGLIRAGVQSPKSKVQSLEPGSENQTPDAQGSTPAPPTPNAQHPTPNAPSPTPNTQHPTPHLGVKLMNTRFDLDFQVEMVRVLLDEAEPPPDYLVYANRLFDPAREFEGKVGVAYGGPDLSRRNLEGLRAVARARRHGRIRRSLPSLSGTGDILTGRMAAEYGLLGASSCQMHTLFQLPDREFGATTRNKTAAVLHHLVFHPESGLLAWLLHLGEVHGRPVAWLDLPRVGEQLIIP